VSEQKPVDGQAPDEAPEKAAEIVPPAESAPPPLQRTPKQRLERVLAVMREEAVDFRSAPTRVAEGMRGTFIADVIAIDTRTNQPLL